MYELGEEHLQRLTSKDNAQARAFYEQAVALEPQFASAHAELGAAYLWELVFVSTSSSERNVALALESARRAVELDPRDWTGHCILAYALLFSHDAANGLASAQRAVDLNPSAPVAWNVLGYAKLSAGDPAGSIAANEQAIRLDPQGSWVATDHETLSEAHWELGQFEAGLEHARTYVTMRPEIYWAYVDMAMNAVGLGRLDDARAAIAEARRVQPDLSLAMIRQNTGFSRPEFNARREAALREAGLE